MKNIVVLLICFLIHIDTAFSYIRPIHVPSMSSMRHGPTFVDYFFMWTFLGIISLILLFVLFAFCTQFLPDRVSRGILFIFVGIYFLIYFCIKIIIKPFQLLYAILWSKK